MYTVHWYAASTTSRAWVWKLIVMGIIIPVAAGVFIVVFFIMPRCQSEIDSDMADGIEFSPLLEGSSYDTQNESENKVCICFYACILLKLILTVNNQWTTILGPKLNI
jgi:hypothetical protein